MSMYDLLYTIAIFGILILSASSVIILGELYYFRREKKKLLKNIPIKVQEDLKNARERSERTKQEAGERYRRIDEQSLSGKPSDEGTEGVTEPEYFPTPNFIDNETDDRSTEDTSRTTDDDKRNSKGDWSCFN